MWQLPLRVARIPMSQAESIRYVDMCGMREEAHQTKATPLLSPLCATKASLLWPLMPLADVSEARTSHIASKIGPRQYTLATEATHGGPLCGSYAGARSRRISRIGSINQPPGLYQHVGALGRGSSMQKDISKSEGSGGSLGDT